MHCAATCYQNTIDLQHDGTSPHSQSRSERLWEVFQENTVLFRTFPPMLLEKPPVQCGRTREWQLRCGKDQWPSARCCDTWPIFSCSTLIAHWRIIHCIRTTNTVEVVHIGASKPKPPKIIWVSSWFCCSSFWNYDPKVSDYSCCNLADQRQIVESGSHPVTTASSPRRRKNAVVAVTLFHSRYSERTNFTV